MIVCCPRWAGPRDHRPGCKPALSDAELACLAVAQQLLGIASERRWIRYARKQPGRPVPATCPASPDTVSGCGRSGGLLAAVITELARDTASWHDLLRLLDSTPVPCGAVSRDSPSVLSWPGWAAYGYCASHSLHSGACGCTCCARPTACRSASPWPPTTPSSAKSPQAMLKSTRPAVTRAAQGGELIVSDKGFAGQEFEQPSSASPWTRPWCARTAKTNRRARIARAPSVSGSNRSIKTTKSQLRLEDHGGHIPEGVLARVLPACARPRRRRLAQLGHRRIRSSARSSPMTTEDQSDSLVEVGEHVPAAVGCPAGPPRRSVEPSRKKGGSMRRMIALTMISVCVAGGATECGGGGSAGQQSGGSQSSGAQSSGTEQAMTVLRQLARCIRSHGMPSFPGPIINPLTNQHGFSRQPRRTPQPAPSRPASPSTRPRRRETTPIAVICSPFSTQPGDHSSRRRHAPAQPGIWAPRGPASGLDLGGWMYFTPGLVLPSGP